MPERPSAVTMRGKPLTFHRESSFGLAYGLLIKEHRLLTMTVIVVDQR